MMRASVIHPETSFSRILPNELMPNFRGRYLSIFFVLFSKILNFWFFYEFFLLSLTWDHMGEKFQMISPLKECNRFTPKTSCIPLGTCTVSTKVAQRTVKFWNVGFFAIFFSFSLTWDYMGVKFSNDISSESTHLIRSPKFMCTPREDLYRSC